MRYATSDGLTDDRLTSVAVMADGTVWIGTRSNGITRFVPEG